MTGTPSNRHVKGPRSDEQAASDPTPASPAERCTCNHHADALDHIRNARTLGGHAGIAEGLAAIAHAILATSSEEPR